MTDSAPSGDSAADSVDSGSHGSDSVDSGTALAPESVDSDGDGVDAGADCDDADATVFPGAPEVDGDGVDSNCDGSDRALGGAPTRHVGESATVGAVGRPRLPSVELGAHARDTGDSGPAGDSPPLDTGSRWLAPQARCGCASGAPAPVALGLLAAVVGLARRRRAS